MSCAGLSHARATGSGQAAKMSEMAHRPRRTQWPGGRSPRRGVDSGAGGRGSRRIDAASSPRGRRTAPRPGLRDLSGPGTTESKSDSVTPGPVSPGLGPVGLPDKVTAARGRLRPRACVSQCACVCGGGKARGTAAFVVEGKEGGKAPMSLAQLSLRAACCCRETSDRSKFPGQKYCDVWGAQDLKHMVNILESSICLQRAFIFWNLTVRN